MNGRTAQATPRKAASAEPMEYGLEIFAQGESWLHFLDPRAKLAVALGFSLVVALGSRLEGLVAVLVAAAALLASARLPLKPLVKRLVAVNLFVGFLWLFLPYRLYYEPNSWCWLGLAPQPGGLKLALAITLKSNAIILATLALLSTSRVNDILHSLAHFRLPAKLLHLFLFFYRYLHVMHQELDRLRTAMRVRGFRPRNNMHTYRSYANLAGTLLVRSYNRAQRVYAAMLCRGFSGTYWLLDHFHWRRRDTVFSWSAAAVVIAAGLVCLEMPGWK